MSDVREEWNALLQDVRTLVEVERGRGVTHVRTLPLAEEDVVLKDSAEAPPPRVFGVGSESAELVVVCEVPRFDSDAQGDAFSGPAGEMLERMLENVIGLAKGEVYTLNIVKTRSPESRDGAQDETASLGPVLRGRLEALSPRVLLVFGSVGFKALFETQDTITGARGAWRDWNGVPTMLTFHPAYLLRKPGDKGLAFADLKKVRARYDELTGRH